MIEASEVKDHPFKHRLTRAVGVWDDVMPFTSEIQLEDGDLVVLASDGVETAGIGTDVVREVLNRDDLETGLDELVDMCLARGGPDNVTIAVARYGKDPVPAVATTLPGLSALDRASKSRRRKKS
jgi:protein phosphatase